MVYDVKVYVTWKEGVLDPQGAAVTSSLNKLGFDGVEDVRISKMITLKVEATENVEEKVTAMCEKLLANPVIEDYTFEIEEAVRT
ncbi:phosphoribosylformylglycinamidine synthase subunit PurS [Paenalkalicoccus suaedae]|uniref:Phosphoribosylformylglycinamidine synthase subunit PurS n=1 Tax=Paenalkalicoccus suaedae TaxID=2592382 RepID=A0A859FDW5_9BACI|nr:phosphoribosylformylglycinamidine synthase subunit PurS [Paenalkalicoccus suaedae]QKS70416.1 phosphoribosylformylglycinamidine synthase subunit PurS [Paenalkalicoccus suaedae]